MDISSTVFLFPLLIIEIGLYVFLMIFKILNFACLAKRHLKSSCFEQRSLLGVFGNYKSLHAFAPAFKYDYL